MQYLNFKETSLSNKLILLAVPALVAFFTFHITKTSLDNTLFGALTFNFNNNLIVIPTATLSSFMFGLFIFLCLRGFLRGVYNNYELDNSKLKISRGLQVIALTALSIYASFNLQSELLSASEYGSIGLDILPDFKIIIPTAIISTLALSGLCFFILIEFLASLAKDVGTRHSQAVQKLVTGAYQMPGDATMSETVTEPAKS